MEKARTFDAIVHPRLEHETADRALEVRGVRVAPDRPADALAVLGAPPGRGRPQAHLVRLPRRAVAEHGRRRRAEGAAHGGVGLEAYGWGGLRARAARSCDAQRPCSVAMA